MLRSSSSRLVLAAACGALLGVCPRPAAAQAASGGRIVSSQVNISRDEAALDLDLAGGRNVDVAIRDGHVWADGRDLGEAPRGGPLDRAWRSLLNRAMDTPTAQLAGLLRGWDAPSGDVAGQMRRALDAVLSGADAAAADAAPPPPAPAAPPAPIAPPAVGGVQGVPSSDSLNRLQSRIEALQQRVQELQDRSVQVRTRARRAAGQARDLDVDGTTGWLNPLRHVWRGISDLVASLVVLAVLFGIGFAVVFFGGRPYLEAVADTARHQMGRSWLVGVAASFLVLPAFVLGIIALTVSIIGIPALLVWVPLFPVAVVLAALFGYLAVGHAAGEALAERRFYGGEWMQRANSYYYLLTGLGLLMALFLASNVVEMAGPWLSFIHGTLTFLAVVLTCFAFTTGLGAVLISRAGTRPPTSMAGRTAPGVFEEEAHV